MANEVRIQHPSAGAWVRVKPGNVGAEEWESGANDLGWSVYSITDAAYRLTVNNAGSFGIGTTDTTTGGFNNKAVIKQGGDGNWRGLGIEGNASGGHVLSIDYLGSNTFGIYTSYRAAPAAYSDIAFGPGGSEKVRFTTGGNVGIGTTNPGTKLHVSQDQTTIADNTALVTLESIGTATVNKGRVLDVYTTRGDGFTDGYIAQFRNLVDTKMYIRGDGNVGIGLTNPDTALEVLKSTSITNTIAEVVTVQAKTTGTFAAGFGPTIKFMGSMTGQDNVELGHIGAVNINGAGAYGELVFYTRPNAASQERMRITYGGNLGIGTASPGYTLTVNGTAWCTSGAWTGSDLRWKENIKTLPDETLNKVLKLRGVSFDWKRAEFKGNNFPEGRQIGLIAQELEKEFPELVTTDNQGYKAIAYDRFTAVLLEAMKAQHQGQQQQQREIENLKAEIASLKKKL